MSCSADPRLEARSGILVVDDSIGELKALVGVLASEGHSVRPASSGRQALRMVDDHPPELVLLDVHLGDMEGYEVCRLLHADERFRSIPVLFLSGVVRPEERVAGFAAGGVDFLDKPFQREELLARVRTHLELSRLREGLENAVRERTAHLECVRRRLEEESAERRSAQDALSDAEAEHARLQAQLCKIQRLESIGKLAGGIAHDFNNILTVILCHAELGKRPLAPEHPTRRCLDEILFAAKRSAALTRQLLTFARSQHVEPIVLDLNRTVTEILKMLGRILGEGVEVDWKPGADLGHVRMDPSQVDQILANLCINARDAMGGEGRLTIETDRFVLDEDEISSFPEAVAGEYVRLSISDTGSGMTPDVYEKIFEPFFTTKEPGKGTGLGLATVFGAVRQNGGFIEVETAPGEGSVFRIHLPLCTESRLADSPSAVLAMELDKPATILLVEDASAVMAVARLSLERRQHTILAATDSTEALRIAQEYPGTIDLLLTDVVMPGTGGRELARRIRRCRPEIRVLFMTGYSREVLGGQQPLEEGMAVLPKPFTSDSLAAKVAETLRS